MDIFDKYPQGYWKSGDKKFINKHQALADAAKHNISVQYVFFDHVWQNFDRSLLGKYSLKDLYRQRAQQLRDKYDYLILYFSGGADSYNVLRSFLDNGIKLDEVCIKWCNDSLTANTEIYRPNQKETSATNYLSEWDYAIKPVLEWLGQHHSDVKIEVVDWFKNRDTNTIETAFNLVNHWHDVEVNSLAVWSPSENKLLEKGTSVGSIYGVDKPCIFFMDDSSYMYFPDGATTMGTPNPNNIFGTEYFYWAHELPELTFEMANVAIHAFKTDQELAQVAVTDKNRSNKQFTAHAFQVQQKRLRHILYDNWTDKFQAFKPITPDRSDKHRWIYNNKELNSYVNEYKEVLNSYLTSLGNSQYLGYTADKSIHTLYRPIMSKRHLVRNNSGF
jgi:hypothetical protein